MLIFFSITVQGKQEEGKIRTLFEILLFRWEHGLLDGSTVLTETPGSENSDPKSVKRTSHTSCGIFSAESAQ